MPRLLHWNSKNTRRLKTDFDIKNNEGKTGLDMANIDICYIQPQYAIISMLI